MLRIKTRLHVFVGTLVSVAVAVLLIHLHILINYPPEVRSLVQVKAITATIVVTTIMSSVIWMHLRKSYLLTLELQNLVDRDRLTSVASREFFFRKMEQMPQAVGVSLMADIDHFKRINDTYGHLVGDKVIQEVALILAANIRDGDIVCRFGGEEFVIFLSGVSAREGFDAAERMRKQVASAKVIEGGVHIPVSISIGGASEQTAGAIEEAIRAADAALYRAKLGGRNRTAFEGVAVADAIAVGT